MGVRCLVLVTWRNDVGIWLVDRGQKGAHLE
jgi:hypothetical protein